MKTHPYFHNSLITSTTPYCEGRVNRNKSLFATLNGGAHFRWVPSFLFIAVLVGALLSGAVLMAKPDTKTSNSPLALSKAFYCNQDTMRRYQALLNDGRWKCVRGKYVTYIE